MNDQFLHDLRREPPPAFTRRLRAALDDQAGREPQGVLFARLRRWAPMAATLAAVAVLFAFPSVRVSAVAFLDLFRVASVVGVAVDPQPLQNLVANGFDLPALIGESDVSSAESSPPVTVGTVEEAESLSGMDVLVPAWRPAGIDLTAVQVSSGESASFEPQLDSLALIMDALGIDDLSLPEGLDGEQVSIRIPQVVELKYGDTGNSLPQVDFVQALSPEVSMPAGIDLPVLAEIALRIAGLDRDEAYRLAWSIDWRSTLIIPVPVREASFSKIDLNGNEGVAVVPNQGTPMLLWSNGEQVFAMTGLLPMDELLEMARTAQ